MWCAVDTADVGRARRGMCVIGAWVKDQMTTYNDGNEMEVVCEQN